MSSHAAGATGLLIALEEVEDFSRVFVACGTIHGSHRVLKISGLLYIACSSTRLKTEVYQHGYLLVKASVQVWMCSASRRSHLLEYNSEKSSVQSGITR
jgi:hypothetical protein